MAAGAVLLVVVGGSFEITGRPTHGTPSASSVPTARSSATSLAKPVSAASAVTSSPSASPTPALSPAADIGTALSSPWSWVSYTSRTYRFTIKHPIDWTASETQTQGWAIFSGWDDSNLSVTWRPISRATSLNDITAEVSKTMLDAGYTIGASETGTIAGQAAQILTLDGTSSPGHPRHGIIGIVATASGRYRVELWSRPGSDGNDRTLFDTFASTFLPA